MHFTRFSYKPQVHKFCADFCPGSLSNLGYRDLEISIKIGANHKTRVYIKRSVVSSECYKPNVVHVLAKCMLTKNLQSMGQHVRRQNNGSHSSGSHVTIIMMGGIFCAISTPSAVQARAQRLANSPWMQVRHEQILTTSLNSGDFSCTM